MTRLYLAIGAVVILLAGVASVYFLGERNAADRAERDAFENTINNGDRFNEKARNPDACGWSDWLRETCPD